MTVSSSMRSTYALLALAALPCACVTEKSVRVDTSPTGAMVNLNGLLVGRAPCTLVLERTRRALLFEVYPPPESEEKLWTQKRQFFWKHFPNEDAVVYFDLHLEPVHPTQPVEIRER